MASNQNDESGEDSSQTFQQFMQQYSEEELASLLIIIGAIMLFIPGLNIIGIIAVVLGVIVWFADWLWG